MPKFIVSVNQLFYPVVIQTRAPEKVASPYSCLARFVGRHVLPSSCSSVAFLWYCSLPSPWLVFPLTFFLESAEWGREGHTQSRIVKMCALSPPVLRDSGINCLVWLPLILEHWGPGRSTFLQDSALWPFLMQLLDIILYTSEGCMWVIPSFLQCKTPHWWGLDSDLFLVPISWADFECWFSSHPVLTSSFSFWKLLPSATEGSYDATVATEHILRKRKKRGTYYCQFSYLLPKAWNFKTT